MLAGRLQLTRCRDLRYLPAPGRCTSISIATCASTVRVDKQGHNRPWTSWCDYRRSIECCITRCNVTALVSRASFSTTSRHFLVPDKRQRKFLEPRDKPKFRKRSKGEKGLFLKALHNARGKDDEKKTKRTLDGFQSFDAYLNQEHNHDEAGTITSPFFASSSSTFHGQSMGPKRTTSPLGNNLLSPPVGFPPLASLARGQATTQDLERELHYLAHNNPHPKAIYNLLHTLVYDRRIKPGPQHYEALILTNCWPEYGSVKNVEKILAEMETEGLEMGAGIISAVLKVLGIRPSPELSHVMLTMVDRQWVQLSQQTRHHLILSTIRAGQVELASWMLDVLRTNNRRDGQVKFVDREIIPDYLVVLLIVELVKVGDWEGVLRYMYKLRERRAADREIPCEFWGWVLERASKASKMATEQEGEEQSHVGGKCTNSHRDSALDLHPPNTGSATSMSKFSRQSDTGTLSSPSSPSPPRNSTPSPPQHLLEYIWRLYVEPMSVQPSWTTCLDTLHVAARTGKVWLAESASAVMSYTHGVSSNGKPKISGSWEKEVLRLVEMAKSKDRNVVDNNNDEEEKRKKKKDKEEDEKWWDEMLSQLPPHPSTSSPSSSSSSQSPPKQKTLDSTTDPGKRLSQLLPRDHPVLHPAKGNLWPIFPQFEGTSRSGLVDAWTTLGPRSSARGKWTEAQRYYKEKEREGKIVGERRRRKRRGKWE